MSETRSLQEVLFVAHFSTAQPMTVLDLADWYKSVAEIYPVFQQQPAWEPFIWQNIDNTAAGHQVLHQFVMNRTFLQPRIVGFSEDQRWSVHCQGDRVAMGWRRLEPTGDVAPYPGFDVVLKKVAVFMEGFRAWWLSQFGIPVAFQICELNYFNAFPFDFRGRTLRASEIFKFVTPQKGRKLAQFHASWIEPGEPPEQARVNCLTAMGPTADCPSAAIFNFMGSAKLEQPGSPDKLRSIYGTLHDAITAAYLSTINSEIIGSQE